MYQCNLKVDLKNKYHYHSLLEVGEMDQSSLYNYSWPLEHM